MVRKTGGVRIVVAGMTWPGGSVREEKEIEKSTVEKAHLTLKGIRSRGEVEGLVLGVKDGGIPLPRGEKEKGRPKRGEQMSRKKEWVAGEKMEKRCKKGVMTFWSSETTLHYAGPRKGEKTTEEV